MTRRLLLSYLGLALLILVALEIPLGVLAARHERDLLASQAEREATGLAVVTADNLEHGRTSEVVSIVAQYRARTGGDVAVIDASGHVVARSDIDHDNDVTGDERHAVDAALAGREVSTVTSDEGQSVAVAAVPVSSDGRPRGAVLLDVPASGTEDRIHDIWMALGGLAAAVLVLTALVGLWLARSLSQPLARLEYTVSRLGAGHLTARARVDDGPPQVRSLARQFNDMAARLVELVEAQSRFVADASHQLRSPLTALRLRLENLEADLEGPPADGIAAAGLELQRLSRLVDGLLTLSRADSDRPERQPIDVEDIIAARCDAWSALAEERHVHLDPAERFLGQSLALLVPGDMEQILDNLLANALDASPEGGRITVTIASTRADGFEVHVVDHGPGMSEEDRRRAFDRFWQGSGHRGGHSGLGLAIVSQLAARNDVEVELHPATTTGLDAVIRVRALPGRGAKTPITAGPRDTAS